MTSLEQLLARARASIERFEPAAAAGAADSDALIVDIRSNDARLREGVIPGSIHVPRTVLEWRMAEDSAWRNPHVGGVDRRVILVCEDGESSSLAAATLRELGFERAGDLIGGFVAWREAGLPVTQRLRLTPPGELPGMGPPA